MALEPIQTAPNQERLELSAKFSWPAIFAGAFIGFGLELLFASLWSGVVFSSVDPIKGQTFGSSFQIWTVVYICLSLFLTFFIGGYAASRFSNQRFKLGALLHSLTSWALVTVFVGTLGLFAVNSLVGNVVRSSAQLASVAVSGITNAAPALVQKIPPNLLQQIQSGTFNRNTLAGQLAKQLNISRQQALNLIDRVVNQARSINFGQSARRAAQAVMNVGSALSWATFCTIVLSLFGSIVGGLVGARSSLERRADVIRSRRAA